MDKDMALEKRERGEDDDEDYNVGVVGVSGAVAAAACLCVVFCRPVGGWAWGGVEYNGNVRGFDEGDLEFTSSLEKLENSTITHCG
ncbi:hypothetical protein RUM43_012719 [Polyplax serrata]|uniref:Uncharacterized protein n=1 Tax=Polyplax serrata TaxID=468196 RepID=A0AAN8NYD1_POLSC